jgi:peptidoglycan hydrolase-like protein with peptidoglycan-binding domain
MGKVWTQGNGNRLAKSLVKLIDDIDLKFPGRETESDGTIGDKAHQARKSDHNPSVQHNGQGIVRALDVTHDPGGGFDAGAFAEALRESRDPRILNVIFNGRIFSSTVSPWVWRDRNKGPGDHTRHVHISVVENPALFDDTGPWAALGQVSNTPSGKTPAFPPKLQLGDRGPAVVDLQNLLGIEADGIFGSQTEQAVRAFQASRNLEVDGVVGTHTWGALGAIPNPTQTGPVGLSSAAIEQIVKLAAESDLAGIDWPGRGRAPRGYVKGMAVTFGQTYAKWKAGDSAARVMAAMNSGNEDTDALAWYDAQFRAAGMENGVSGADTLRHLFVLLYGLGMRESTGRYFVGRDTTANNTDADTAEAGLFQMSWNMKNASPELPRLFALYSAKPDGFLPIFQEGVTPDAANLENVGTGEGVAYQQLCKSCPAFAVETAAVGLRARRKHWGPINRREAEVRGEADRLLQQVQAVVDASVPVVPKPEDIGPIGIHPLPTIDPQQLIALILTMLSKEKTMDAAKPGQKSDPLQALLPLLLQAMLSGKQLNTTDLLTVLLTGKAAPAPAAPATPTGNQQPATPAQSQPADALALLVPLIYERLTGKPWPGAEEAKPAETPVETPQAAISKPSVQLSAAALAVTTTLQALGIVGTPFNMGAEPTQTGTLATLIPIATALIGATGGFGTLLTAGRALLGGLGRRFGTPK